jgi:triacylglycerol lipase
MGWIRFHAMAMLLLVTANFSIAGGSDPKAMHSQDRSPVVLVHGFLYTARAMEPMARFLGRRGFEVHTLTMSPSWGQVGIDELARQLAAFIDSTFSPGQRISLVGFSMGGLTSRYYLQRMGGLERVDRFVTVSTPHRGTILAHLSGRTGARQMRPGSPFLRDLNRDIETLERATFGSVWTPFDLMVLPPNSSRVPVGEERVRWVAAHPLMVLQPTALRAVAELLER